MGWVYFVELGSLGLVCNAQVELNWISFVGFVFVGLLLIIIFQKKMAK